MVIIKLSGGFGNQIFQFAAGLSLAISNKIPLLLDKSRFLRNSRKYELDSFYGINDYHNSSILNVYLANIFSKKYTEEKEFFYKPIIYKKNEKLLIDGYFQSYKYSENIKNILVNLFDRKSYKFNSSLLERNYMKVNNCESVSVHIRRGDYLKNKHNLEYHGVLNLSYYLNSIDFMRSRINNPKFFIFSDDILWAKKNLPNSDDIFFLDNSHGYHLDDFMIMKECRHNIIANSSYSWWAAHLNVNTKKNVVAPKNWIKGIDYQSSDLFPFEWNIFN